MKESLFIINHQKTWQELENILKEYNSGNKKTDGDTLHRLFDLYQTVCGHLSIARTRYGNTGTVDYLNNLVSRAHQAVYTSRPGSLQSVAHFLAKGFPALIKREYRAFLLSAGVFVFGFLFSFLTVLYWEDYALSFIPAEYVTAVRNLSGNTGNFNFAVASVAIFTNNIRVGIIAFALGITFGVGTVYVLAKNGMILGAMAAVSAKAGTDFVFWSLILPHGIPELFCIFVCGAAGLTTAKHMIFPGLHSRRKSFSAGGKKSLMMFLGTIPIFILAGLTEGYITPLPVEPAYKYAAALVWLIVLTGYIFSGKKSILSAK
ncbi:hypothetical protein CSTERTH_03130 [Thermoclostridium stercorarium subsp. thermolacticum DSM 2910]|jgi:uncharacterized membrane protein SpoIIM required for sporulation|uniref:Stage II sporulation protein M n=1 Tax=Thermoclostridium stercorarium subsp. thermolacticum DSM 2910 TaxID=1121336 RepID=A0A1B1YBG6_THEST|nr:stage II sporulation protein M [Thermoclostridium stercorarium]ANW98106.1 hypothetical protein CSTERTH_03130 [Thermoclostridium stercorarium subsp. thermolacticum DSM 2910]UZQ86262.1 stage II sporulation protein M [Thermoclostridium stercorarium]